MKRVILLMDDERLVMEYYIRALKNQGFHVRQCFDPDSCFEFIEKENPDISAIILDIMMPPGKKYRDEDTHEGLKTGVFMLKDLRDVFPDVPIVVLTSVRNQVTLNQFQKGPKLQVVQKLDVKPFKLAELVNDMIRSSAVGSQSGN